MIDQYYFVEFVKYAGELLCTMAYADAHENGDLPDECQGASMGSDWMDAVPSCVPSHRYWMAVAHWLGAMESQIGICVPALVKSTVVLNDPDNFSEESDYDSVAQATPPNGYYSDIVDYLASCFVHDFIGTGCGIRDYGWKWPEELEEYLSNTYTEVPCFMSVVPDLEEFIKEEGV